MSHASVTTLAALDSSGNASVQIGTSQANSWFLGFINCGGAGPGATWKVVQGGIRLGTGFGDAPAIGPIFLDVGEVATVVVSGGNANVPISILQVGDAGYSLDPVPPVTSPSAATVQISGTSTVTIAGTPAVTISGTVAVAISGTPTVNIGNTPAVTISGTPTVNVGTVSGPVAISGTVTVSVSNTPAVTISGTPSVSISGTPTVNIGNSPTVAVSGTVSVSIAAGSVSISGTPSINILSQSVNLATQQPQTALADLAYPLSSTSTQTTAAVPTGTHALLLGATGNGLNNLAVVGHTTGLTYFPSASIAWGGITPNLKAGEVILVPVAAALDTQYDISGSTGPTIQCTLKVVAILDTSAVSVSNTPISPLFVTVDIPDGQVPLPVTHPKFDGQGNHTPGAGTQATVTLAAVANRRWVCYQVAASMEATTAAAAGVDVVLRDGASGAGTVLWSAILGVTAAIGSSSRDGFVGSAFRGTNNTPMTIEFTTGVANINERVTIGAYLQAP